LVEAANDFVGIMGQYVCLTKSSAEALARDVKNFRGTSFSFGRAKENEHASMFQSLAGFRLFFDSLTVGQQWF
jgi:hypothetical protein